MKVSIQKKIFIIVIILISAMLTLGGFIMMRDINEAKSISINEIKSIRVDMTSIGVNVIRTETSNEVKVNFHGKAMQEIKLISKIDGSTFFITVQRKHEKMPIYEDVVLDVYIPATYTRDLLVKVLSSAVRMDSFGLSNFTFDTSSGVLEAKKIEADKIFITSSSGRINIDECSAKMAEMETVSGGITLKNSTGNLDLKSKSGKVLINFKKFEEQSVSIKTFSGGVTLELPNNAEFLINAKTSTGNIKTDFFDHQTSKKELSGQIGNKKNNILIQTYSGSVGILKNK